MEKLWAPWRMEYIRSPAATPCVFCLDENPAEDSERLILLRGRHSFVMMNRYPYTNGHLLVVPRRHLSEMASFETAEVLEIHNFLVACQQVLQDTCAAQGFNLGWNVGPMAGAGISEHLHLHVVPRWAGDTNFMPVLADVRVVPQHLRDTYAQLRPVFLALAGTFLQDAPGS